MSNAGTVRAHPLHIVASCDLARLYVDSSKDSAVVDDVPDVIANLLESDILAPLGLYAIPILGP